MPRKNGLQCLEVIRKDRDYDWVPVFIYSTTRNDAQIDDAYEKKANLFLRKPEGYNDITTLITKLTGRPPESYFPQPAKADFIISYGLAGG
jgi:CheY-like chemotaxis protein